MPMVKNARAADVQEKMIEAQKVCGFPGDRNQMFQWMCTLISVIFELEKELKEK